MPSGSVLRTVGILVTTGALAAGDERVVALEAWLSSTAEQSSEPEDRRAFIAFDRWRHIRRARQKALTESQLPRSSASMNSQSIFAVILVRK